MKKSIMLGMTALLMSVVACNDENLPRKDNQHMQREEEMNRGDMVDDYKQKDLGSGRGEPSNVYKDPAEGLEEGANAPAADEDPAEGLEEGAPHNIQR